MTDHQKDIFDKMKIAEAISAELSALHPNSLGKMLTLGDLRKRSEAAQEIIRLEDKLHEYK